jgi:hypothetical protein
VSDTAIRIAGPSDAPTLARLRRAWVQERDGEITDEDFEARFAQWYERGSGSRVTWLAQVRGEPVGLMSLTVFERMPRPGRDAGRWGYLGNAFVLAAYRNTGTLAKTFIPNGPRLSPSRTHLLIRHRASRVPLPPAAPPARGHIYRTTIYDRSVFD